jgi:excisionase family DNA binding protein
MQSPEITATPKLLTYGEAARFLRVSEKTIWTLTHNNTIPLVRILRRCLIDEADLVRFIERQKSASVEGVSNER